MIGQGTKRFDLYDFFSVFIPGSAFVVGLSPLMPQRASEHLPLLSAIVLIGGFIAGRWIHAFALKVEAWTGARTHRDVFKSELQRPQNIDERLVNSFYKECQSVYPDALPDKRPGEGSLTNPGDVADTAYVLARSAIHSDSSGRSRTFQAIVDFYRSAWLASGLLAAIYILYSLNAALGLIVVDAGFNMLLSDMSIPPLYIMGGALLVFVFALWAFRGAQPMYRRYYVQYLFADFLTIARAIEPVNE